jgi:hypothetical protein
VTSSWRKIPFLVYMIKLSLSVLFCLLLGIIKAQENPVIVELFTSQGCSSCPAADRNLSKLVKENGVLGLSFHVDYWNYIGWKDPYSQKLFTERQRIYAEKMNSSSVYTPQMIVNGKTQFVGSDLAKASLSIKKLNDERAVTILVSELIVKDGKASLTYAVDQLSTNDVINCAIVEKSIENYIPRGENKGLTLHHDNVVRAFETFPLQTSATIEIVLPDVKRENTSLILYIQDKNWKVKGATLKSLL